MLRKILGISRILLIATTKIKAKLFLTNLHLQQNCNEHITYPGCRFPTQDELILGENFYSRGIVSMLSLCLV